MKYFFNPRSVAVVGASRNEKKIGHVILRNLTQGYRGKVYPVNPKSDEILDLKCYPKVSSIPGNVDLVVISVHAQIVPEILEDCGKKGVKAAIIVSGGFSEIGETKLEEEIKRIGKKHNIRIIGPNCIGVYNPGTKVDTLFLPAYRLGRPVEGKISFISQSGALGGAMLDWANMNGYGFSKFVSYGNAVDVDETDLIEFLGKDKETSLIAMYIEGVTDGRRFMDVCKRVSKRKPIVAIKGGRTAEGGNAVSSHTGSLAGSSEVYSAAFKQSGVIEADDLEEVFNFARVLTQVPPVKGKRVQIITNGGGLGILTVDALIKEGFELAKMNEKTIKKLKEKLPSYAVIKNPIDLTGDADTDRYSAAIEAALEDKNVDIIIVNLLFQVPTLGSDVLETISEKFNEKKKPIVAVCFGGEYTRTHKKALERYGVPTFSYPDRAAKALSCLVANVWERCF